MKTGYCCNVHGGTTLQEVKSNLERFACEVKRQVSPDEPMPVGLWLSESALAEIADSSAAIDFGGWLAQRGLDPFTLNGFPQGDFHQDVVKHDVYLPTWASEERLRYTQRLATVHCELLAGSAEPDAIQTISTLPLGWPTIPKSNPFADAAEFLEQCAANLKSLAQFLSELKQRRGNHVMVCIEPEPGCVLDTGEDIVRFFQEYLLDDDSAESETILDHIGICHDVCHSAVMFEDQESAVAAYQNAGIRIGKVQVSAAVKVSFEGDDTSAEKRDQLSSFAETRYLHQTTVRCREETKFYEDLSVALDTEKQSVAQWRVHFHVPIFVETLGTLATTQNEIRLFIEATRRHGLDIPHFEIETYAWNVLPEAYQSVADDLASGIAKEMLWFDSLMKQFG